MMQIFALLVIGFITVLARGRRYCPSLLLVGPAHSGKTRLFYALRDGIVASTVTSSQRGEFRGMLPLIGSEVRITDLPSSVFDSFPQKMITNYSVVLFLVTADTYKLATPRLVEFTDSITCKGIVCQGISKSAVEAEILRFMYSDDPSRRESSQAPVSINAGDIGAEKRDSSGFTFLEGDLVSGDSEMDVQEVMRFLHHEL